ncbi:MAG: galactokinase family protein [Oscillospiraceae bacterium]|nr:galactokinase family protein [Oscillospiraceae bacterium]
MENNKNSAIIPRSKLYRLYPGQSAEEIEKRLEMATEGFARVYGKTGARLFSAPGRTELGGNHTDHQHGLVIAAAVGLDDVAAALPNGDGIIRIFSDAYGSASIDPCNLLLRPDEAGTPASLVRGVAEYLSRQGRGHIGGFDALISGLVPVGSGLSSSAAFETLIACVINGLFFEGEIPPETLAHAGQYAENTHFGKPCGLMDQMASAVGGIIEIDFENPDAPHLERLSVDFSDFGYALCIIDTGTKHDGLGEEYAAIPAEMTKVARLFGEERLRSVPPERFYAELPKIRSRASDRALLRAMHFFGENERVPSETAALKSGDFGRFLHLVRESGKSSSMLLQNIYPGGSAHDQSAALALAWCERLLDGSGACRIHGGGFGGTIQAFVPISTSDSFREGMERLTGAGSCRFLKIRDAGAVEIEA